MVIVSLCYQQTNGNMHSRREKRWNNGNKNSVVMESIISLFYYSAIPLFHCHYRQRAQRVLQFKATFLEGGYFFIVPFVILY